MDAEELRVEAETAPVARRPCWSRRGRWSRRRRSGSGGGRCSPRALHQAGRQAEALGARQAGTGDAGRRARPGSGPRARRARAAAACGRTRRCRRRSGREVSADCPYRGLLPYDAEDADSFFGREDDVAACLRRLRDTGVLTVVGPSGIGKSSLVRAGVVASLVRLGTPVLVTTPGRAPDGLADRVEGAGPADPGGGPGRGGGHRLHGLPPSGSGTSPRWPPTWAPAARWCSRCGRTTSATWRRTRTSPGSSRTASTCSVR